MPIVNTLATTHLSCQKSCKWCQVFIHLGHQLLVGSKNLPILCSPCLQTSESCVHLFAHQWCLMNHFSFPTIRLFIFGPRWAIDPRDLFATETKVASLGVIVDLCYTRSLQEDTKKNSNMILLWKQIDLQFYKKKTDGTS